MNEQDKFLVKENLNTNLLKGFLKIRTTKKKKKLSKCK